MLQIIANVCWFVGRTFGYCRCAYRWGVERGQGDAQYRYAIAPRIGPEVF